MNSTKRRPRIKERLMPRSLKHRAVVMVVVRSLIKRRPRIKTRLMPGRQRHNNAKSRIKKKSIRRRLRLGHRKLGWKIEWRIEGPD